MNGKRILSSALAVVLLLILATGLGQAQGPVPQAALGTAFTYQGHLTDGGSPASGQYDMQFELYDDASGGGQVGSTLAVEDVDVSDGFFTVSLDFGDVFDGTALWLQIGVRPGASTGAYTPLSPRQPLTAAPYARYAAGAPWGGLDDVPPDIADGDDDTLYSAGAGLTLVGTTFQVMTSTIQSRVTGSCPAGQSISQIYEDGTVDCEVDDGASYSAGNQIVIVGNVISVTEGAGSDLDADLLDGQNGTYYLDWDNLYDLPPGFDDDVDDDTTYLAGAGLVLDGTTFEVVTSTVQSRVTETCPAGQSIRSIAQDGTVTCEVDTDTTYSAGAGLNLDGTTFEVVTSTVQSRVTETCPAGQAIQSISQDGTVVCETDDDTTYSEGTGLHLSGTQFSIEKTYRLPQGCSGDDVAKWNGTDAWECGDDKQGVTGVYGGDGLSRVASGGDVTLTVEFAGSGSAATVARSDHDHDGTYALDGHDHWGETWTSTGNGLTLNGSSSSASEAILQVTHSGAGSGDSAIRGTSGTGSGVSLTSRAGVWGDTSSGYGVYGTSSTSYGVGGYSPNGYGVRAEGAQGDLFLTGGDGTILSESDVYIHLDDGGKFDSQFCILDDGDNAVFCVDESGTMTSTHDHDDRYWRLTGNSGTTPSANFLGTTDNQALELHVNGARALRLEPHATSPNVIGGYSGNSVTSGAYAATIGGGGQSTWENQVFDSFGTIGGGIRNKAGKDDGNTSLQTVATVGGGSMNTADGSAATVGGGIQNTATGDYGTVPGGYQNEAIGDHSFAAGRRAKANHTGTFVWADSTNADFASTGNDQFMVRATGGVIMVVGSSHFAVTSSASSAPFSVDGSGVTLIAGDTSDEMLWVTNSGGGSAVRGSQSTGSPWASTSQVAGVWGDSAGYYGVVGSSGGGAGVVGMVDSTITTGAGVKGWSKSTGSIEQYGVWGQSDASIGRGVYGEATHATGVNYGVYGTTDSPSGYGVYAENTGADGVALQAAGSGIIKSTAPITIAVSPLKMVADAASDVELRPDDNGDIVVRPNVASGQEVLLPIDLPTVLFGAPLKLQRVEICYRSADSNGYINFTSARYIHSVGAAISLINDTITRDSTSWTCYTMTDTSPNEILGSLFLYFQMEFDGTGSSYDIQIGKITLTLVE